jgi:hypothetical protein
MILDLDGLGRVLLFSFHLGKEAIVLNSPNLNIDACW